MTLQLPHLVEVKILAAIANKALDAGDVKEHERLLGFAIGEAAGHAKIQAALLKAKTEKVPVDLRAIFSLENRRKAASGKDDAEPDGTSATGIAPDP